MRAWGWIGLAALIAAPATAQTVKDGVDAWQRGDYATAVKDWKPLADKGDADAAFDLAQAYKLGRGVPADLASAKRYYGVAARHGHIQGAANYGLLLFQDGDRKDAMPWIEKASEAGDPRAQYVYGTALFNGDLVGRDWPKAYALMTRAAAAGLPQATTSLAQMDKYLASEDKKKGLELANQLAARPMPPISRQALTSPGPVLPPTRTAEARRAPAPAQLAPAPKATRTEPARPAPTKLASAGGKWQVQLGAFSTEASAEAAWRKISGKSAALRSLRPSYEKAGAVVRLRAGPLADRSAAEKACADAKAAGAGCFPVAP